MSTSTQKKPPVVPPLDLSKIEGWNDTYFKVDRKKSRRKKSKQTVKEQEPTNGLGDVGEGLGLSNEVSQAIDELLNESDGLNQFQAKRDEVSLSFDPAVKLLPSLQKPMDHADELAENEDYDAGVKQLVEKVLPECQKVLANAKKEWAVKERKFFEYRKLGERLAETREKQVNSLEERIANAKSSQQANSQQQLERELDQLKKSPERGAKLNALYKEASEAAESLDFAVAFQKIQEATEAGREIEAELSLLAESVNRETDQESAKDKQTFDFASKTHDKNWGFDTDYDAKNFFIGQTTGEIGQLVPSDKLLAMGEQTKAALARLEQLTSAGMSPEKAADIAFKNIPKNFWPDRVVREVIMYQRARAAFEEEKRAELQAQETQDLIDSVLDTEAKLSENLETASEDIKSLHEQLDPEKMEQQKQKAAELGKLGFKTLSNNAQSLLDSEQAKKVEEALGQFAEDFEYATSAFGVLVKGAQAIKAGLDSRKVTEDTPVQKKLAEFKRNKAIFQVVDALIGAGLGLDEICPALKIASGGKDMVQESIKACMYFIKLAEIVDLKSDAKLDPETMMALPLARMARNQGLRASKSTVAVIVAAVQTAGAVGEMSGIGAHAGLALDVTGKVLKYGSKIVFKGIDWADARRCVRTMKKAAGPPPIRKAMTMIFKNSTRYATYALAYGAVEGNDPWAVQYLVNGGLTEDDLKSPATSIEIVREFMLVTAGGIMGEEDEEEDDPTILPELKKKKSGVKNKIKSLAVAGAKKTRDKIVGRDTSAKYDEKWKAPNAELTRSFWQSVKKDAIAAGWYDNRSGLGDVLAEYETVAGAFAKTPSVETVVELGAALDELSHALSEVGTMANDEKTPHAGMLDLVEAMSKKVDGEEQRISPLRQQLYDQQSFGDLQGDELAKAKQAKIDNDLEAAKEKQAKKAAVRLAYVQSVWNKRKHPTPYGNLTLTDFCTKASEKLDLDPEETKALSTSTKSINDECCNQLRDLVSSVPTRGPGEGSEGPFKIDTELNRQATQLEKSLVEDLRTLAQSHYEAMKLRTASDQQEKDEEGDAQDDGSTWTAPNFAVSAAGWTAVKKDAKKHGLSDKPSGISKSLSVLDKAQAAYQKNRADEKLVRLVHAAILDAIKTFEKYKPLNHLKFVHRGMSAYRTKMVKKLQEYDQAFKDEQDRKKVFTEKQKEEDEKEKAIAIQTNYKATPFTKSAWKTVLAQGVKDGLKKEKTGFPDAFGLCEKTLSGYENENDPGKKQKAKELYLKAIANLDKKLRNFDPKLKNKRGHDGLIYWRGQMINELAKIKSGIPN
jgi:hypothetical protein